jgi:ribosomal protein S24E
MTSEQLKTIMEIEGESGRTRGRGYVKIYKTSIGIKESSITA